MSAAHQLPKLWLVSPHFYPTYGGGQNRYRQYIPGFQSRGLDVNIMTATPLPEERSEGDAEQDWYRAKPGSFFPTTTLDMAPLERIRLPDKKSSRRTAMFYDALINVCTRPSSAPVVAQLLGAKPEIQPWVEQLRANGVATACSISQFPGWGTIKAKRWLKGRAYRRLYSSFDALVTNSPELRNFLLDLGITSHIEYIPNGVNLSRFHPANTVESHATRAALRAHLGIPDHHKIIVSIGGLRPRKGPHLAIRAWNKIVRDFPETHLLLIGPRVDLHDPALTAYAKRIENLVQRCIAPDQVHFPGLVDDVEEWLRASDLFILPTDREGTPNSVLEAMATGLPSIVSEHAGLSSALGSPSEHYRLVSRDVDSLARALRELLSDPSLQDKLRKNGLSYVRQSMNQEGSLDSYTKFYADLVNGC